MCTVYYCRLLMQQLCQHERVSHPKFLVLRLSWRKWGTWHKLAPSVSPRESLTDPRVRSGSFQPEQIQFSNYSEIKDTKSQPRICGVQIDRSGRTALKRWHSCIIWTWIDQVYNHRLIKKEAKKQMQPPAEHSHLFCSNPCSFTQTIIETDFGELKQAVLQP